MRKRSPHRLDFEVDKLTNSIENILTGEIFETEIVPLTSADMKAWNENEWVFDWKRELFDADREVYRLIALKDPSIIQGLISFSTSHDHVWIHLVESATFNRSKTKIFNGVPGNLVAYACKISFEKGFSGYVLFAAKTRLIEHYEKTLGAKRLYGNRMFLDTAAAYKLVRRYFKDFDNA